MTIERCEIPTSIKKIIELTSLATKTWLSAQGDEANNAELATSGFDVRSFLRQSRFRSSGITNMHKSNIGLSITFKTDIAFAHISLEVVQASIT